jgi:hypothetical protein
MPIAEAPRVIFMAPMGEPNADSDEGLVVAIGPGDSVAFQLAVSDTRLRGYTEERPPTITMQAAAAVELSREILRQLRPDLAATLRTAERGRLRAVNDADPVGA